MNQFPFEDVVPKKQFYIGIFCRKKSWKRKPMDESNYDLAFEENVVFYHNKCISITQQAYAIYYDFSQL